MKAYNIWSEGWQATGQGGSATYHGTVEATSFKEACDKLAVIDEDFERYYNPDSLDFWGCKLFDNESDARSNFG